MKIKLFININIDINNLKMERSYRCPKCGEYNHSLTKCPSLHMVCGGGYSDDSMKAIKIAQYANINNMSFKQALLYFKTEEIREKIKIKSKKLLLHDEYLQSLIDKKNILDSKMAREE